MSGDCAVLNLKPPPASASSSAIKSAQEETNSIDGKTASISLADALSVDIRDGESALIIRVSSSSSSSSSNLSPEQSSFTHHDNFASSTCRVRVTTSPTQRTGTQSPLKQKREVVVAQGNVQISPLSLYNHFLIGNKNDNNATIKGNKKEEVVAPTSKASSSVSYTSPSKSGFSFAKGGGGDKLISPQTVAAKTPPSKSGFSFAKGGGGDKLISPQASGSKSSFSFAKGGGGDKLTSPQASASKSSFSFAKGGGGDKLTSPQSASKTPPTRYTSTASSSKLKQAGGKVLLLPIISMTKQQRGVICPNARELTICHTFPDVHTDDSSYVIKMLIRSKYQGCYINAPSTRQHDLETIILNQSSATAFETISISFKGQMKSFYIVDATAKSGKGQSPIENEEHLLKAFNNLSLSRDGGDNTSAKSTFLKFIEHQKADNTAVAYRITSKTQINLASSLEEVGKIKESRCDVTSPDKSTTRQLSRLCAGLDDILSKINDTLLPPLIHPTMFPADGPLRPPKGALLFGPPGVGKSCLAAQVALNFRTTNKVFVRSVNCADILSDTAVVGEAEKTLTEIFEEAERNALPNGSLLVLDDVHLICPRRGETKGSDQIAGTLLALLDGINPNQSKRRNRKLNETGGLVVLAVTTDPSSLDPALRRPGRLDVEIEVPVPDESAKIEILSHYFAQFQADTVVDVSADDIAKLARLAKGFTGADCKLAVKEAVRNTFFRNAPNEIDTASKTSIKFSDLDHAIRITKPSAIKSVAVEIPHVSWSDIGGMDHVKSILKESIELPLTHPHLFEMMNVPPPRGILLYGPPGCSKTLMARAIATSGNMNFLAVKGPELLSKWLGESERALASLFRRARLASPSVIFFDELDAIAQKRGSSGGSGGDRLLSQLLTELDGVSSDGRSSRVVIVGATNRPDILDPALTRPGRMDRKIYVGLPDAKGRESIFGIGLKGKRCHEDVDVCKIASDDISHGYTGAEIVSICRDAALLAIGEMDDGYLEQPQIRICHLLEAIKNLKPRTTSEMLHFYDSYGRK
mmetsp:Transcript_19018/g.29734  ORF Transcript_19018/g.29734 Transcript_19018/m.29734 type:complete len:1037 (+) Transcript_19018:63-3173(+)